MNLGNFKLFKDYGVSAFIATLVIAGSFAVIILGLLKGFDLTGILPLIGGWIGGIIGSYFTVKAIKTEREK